MHNTPLVSVLMPAYNCEKYISQAIDCILQQTYQHIELLICDDASKDHTRKIIDNYSDPRIKTYHNNHNLGYLKTCNKLFPLATGQLIGFQDADDYSLPDRIQKQVDYFLKNTDTGIVGTFYKRINKQDKPVLNISDHCLEDHNEIRMAFINGERPFVPGTFLIKKEIIEAVGGYNLCFDRIGSEDYYWTWLLMEQGIIHNLPEKLYVYRLNESSVSGDLSDDPKKLYSNALVQELINQRLKTGTDWASEGETEKIDVWMHEQLKEFTANPHLTYFLLAKRYFYEKRKQKAIRYQLKGLYTRFSWSAFKDLLYFIRK